MHTQHDTAQLITAAGGDYVFTVKKNQPTLYAACKNLPWADVPAHTAVTSGHGRRARRTIKVVTAPAWICFTGARQIAQIRRTVTRAGRKSVEVVYVITSADHVAPPPTTLAAWVQGHWGIENRLHWVRDVTFDEDRSQARTGNSPHVMATLPTPRSACSDLPAGPTSPPPYDITPDTPSHRPTGPELLKRDFAGALVHGQSVEHENVLTKFRPPGMVYFIWKW